MYKTAILNRSCKFGVRVRYHFNFRNNLIMLSSCGILAVRPSGADEAVAAQVVGNAVTVLIMLSSLWFAFVV